MERLDVLHPSIDEYLLDIIPARDEVLTEMEAYARERRFPDCRSPRWACLTPVGAVDQPNANLRDGIRIRLFGVLDGEGVATAGCAHHLH